MIESQPEEKGPAFRRNLLLVPCKPAEIRRKGMLWILFQLVLFVTAFAVLTIGAIWMNAKADRLFRFVGRNQIIAIDRGEGNPSKVLANLPKNKMVSGLKIVTGAGNRNPVEKILKRFGIFFKGFPAKTHVVTFVHERLNPAIDNDTPASQWIIRDKEAKSSDYVLFDKPHWAYVPGVEFSDGFRANILIQYQSLTVDIGVSVYDRGGDFYGPMNAQIEAATLSKCRTMTYKGFTEIDTEGVDSDFCKAITDNANKITPTIAGQEIYGLFVYRYDAASKEEEELRRAEAKAQIQLAVAKLKAQGDIADVTEAAIALKAQFPNANHDELVKTVREISVADRIKDSGLVAWGAGAMVNTSGAKGGNPKPNKKKG